MTKHGHGLPGKRPGRSAKDAIDADLPELEPIDDLPELEPIDDLPELEPLDVDDGPVKVTCVASDDDDYETVVTVEVPDIPKKEVADAVEGPLAQLANTEKELLRYQRVLVRFTGDGSVGGAVRRLVAEQLAPQRPLLIALSSGGSVETVHEGSLPTVEVGIEAGAGETKVTVQTGECEQADLPTAMAAHVVDLVAAAEGCRFLFRFQGGVKPDAETREALATALRDGGARSVAVGARVLFDRDLEDRVKCTVSKGKALVDISLSEVDEEVIDALALVMPLHRQAIDGNGVRFQFARGSAAVQAFCVDFARDAGATLVEVGGVDDYEIVWPPLLNIRAGKEVELRFSPCGRSREALLAAFIREVANHQDATTDQDVLIDWPEGFELDGAAVAALEEAAKVMAPRRLACTVNGDLREPFLPLPVWVDEDADGVTVVVDSEAGKPKELHRAADRRLPEHLSRMKGQSVRIEARGAAPLSRTLREALCGAVADVAARLELAEGGEVDVLLPPMLAMTRDEGGLSISCVLHGRNEAQQKHAVIREMEGVEVALQSVTVHASDAAQLVTNYVHEQGAAQIFFHGAELTRIYPPLLEALESKGKESRLVVEPTGDAAMDARMVDDELADRLAAAGMLFGATVTIAWAEGDPASEAVQKLLGGLRDKKVSKVFLENGDAEAVQLHPEPAPEQVEELEVLEEVSTADQADPAATAAPRGGSLLTLLASSDASTPPIAVVAVADGDEEAHMAAVVGELQEHLPRFVGRAVLLVPQRDGVDVPVRRMTPMVKLLGETVPQAAAATLVFRGPDDQGRAHFEVMHSNLSELPAGGAFTDPRPR